MGAVKNYLDSSAVSRKLPGDSWGQLALPILEDTPITLIYFAGVIVSVVAWLRLDAKISSRQTICSLKGVTGFDGVPDSLVMKPRIWRC